MRLRHRREIFGVEELADRDLMRDRPAPHRTELSRQHRILFIGQLHGEPRSPLIESPSSINPPVD